MLSTLTKSIACWQQEYNTGNSQVDGQHQQLFEIVNALHDAVVARQNIYTIQELLEALANHTIEHFQTEEALMMAVNYPDYDRHKHTHDYLLSKVDRLLLKFRDRNTEAVTTELTQFLTEWLTHHIKGEDQKMIQFFQNQ
ncbi:MULTISPECIES: bacteriohemerythrin [Pseudanabaena]|jgi:hemerythrin|uniref:bacteriohemerythrin n=1 Tax=Pseudanabaena TaxID=1152 RepID=UPI0024784857|nr:MULTISPECIES: bacteriohemerythrin [Pseudanabaena]MEA5486260.1 bacteriohemerythrin [Pseudanabaena sp. CCNP1317]WGS70632.1 bacteriohemerythrin [Pseudanabaena galeata CCNP1313]